MGNADDIFVSPGISQFSFRDSFRDLAEVYETPAFVLSVESEFVTRHRFEIGDRKAPVLDFFLVSEGLPHAGCGSIECSFDDEGGPFCRAIALQLFQSGPVACRGRSGYFPPVFNAKDRHCRTGYHNGQGIEMKMPAGGRTLQLGQRRHSMGKYQPAAALSL